jgi:AraC-like DNA-binding protein
MTTIDPPSALGADPSVVASRARLEAGTLPLPPLDGDHATFGLASSPLVLRSMTSVHRIPAQAPWAVNRNREWRVLAERAADLRLVHVRSLPLGDGGARAFRFDADRSALVRSAIRAATPIWVDQRLRVVDNLAHADPGRSRMVESAASVTTICELRHVFVSLGLWAGIPSEPGEDALRPVLDHIQAHLDDPGLNATTVSTHTLVSRRTIQAAFTAYGGVAAYIRRQRVLAAVTALTIDPDRAPDLDAIAVATGFGSRRTMERAIRAVFDDTPAQIRRRALAGRPVLPRDAVARADGRAS